jgi:predicted transcriptional regulator
MLTIRVPPELVEALDAAALDRGGTRSNLIREALALVVHPCVVDAARARLAREKIREQFKLDLLALRAVQAPPTFRD